MLIIHTCVFALSHTVRSETAEPQPNRSHTTAVAFWSHARSGRTALHSPLTAISSLPAQRLFSPLNLMVSETGNQCVGARCRDKDQPPRVPYPSSSA